MTRIHYILKYITFIESESDVAYGRIRALHLTHPNRTHTVVNTHTHIVNTHTAVNTHPEQWAAMYAAAPGEQLGVRCLAQGHLSRGALNIFLSPWDCSFTYFVSKLVYKQIEQIIR